jgi:cytochrome P450
MTLTPEGAHQVLTGEPDSYAPFQKEAFAALAGEESLFVLDGARHRSERQLLSPSFQVQAIHQYGPAILQIARRHTDNWRPCQKLRAHDVTTDISRDVILYVTLSIEAGELLTEGRRALKRMLDAAHAWLEYAPVFHAWWFLPWRRFQRAKEEFNEFVAHCLTVRRASKNATNDVLDRLIASSALAGPLGNDKRILDEAYTILLPGHATTGSALAWAIYELGRHPAVLQRLREELDALGPDPAPDVIVKQPYLGAVCDETLRLHTIVTEFARLPRTATKLMGYQIPEQVGMGISISAIHQDPTVYANPDDFMPERFLDRTFGPFEFLPFGGGHRRCLGAALNQFEMRIVLATIISRWEFKLCGTEREKRLNLGMGPKHGVRMQLLGRRPKP